MYAALSGFGQTGPYRGRPAVDAVAQAMGGTMSLNGYADGPPLRVGVSIGDMVAGLYLALGVLAALRARDATGEGQLVDVAMMDAQVALCENAIVRHSGFGEAPTRQGSRHPLLAPFGPFPTADGWLVVANVKEWDLFCALIDRDDLALDARYVTNRARVENVESLEAELTATLRLKTAHQWLSRLDGSRAGSFSRVNTIADLFDDPQVAARGMLVELPMPYGLAGSLTVPNSPLRLSGTPAVAGNTMPEHGADTDAVLARALGLSSDELARLRRAGTIK